LFSYNDMQFICHLVIRRQTITIGIYSTRNDQHEAQ